MVNRMVLLSIRDLFVCRKLKTRRYTEIALLYSSNGLSFLKVLYSPRRNEGFGLTDGEGIERLWSYLRKFCYMTKEMTPSRRTDILSEALLHYAKRNDRNQGLPSVPFYERHF